MVSVLLDQNDTPPVMENYSAEKSTRDKSEVKNALLS